MKLLLEFGFESCGLIIVVRHRDQVVLRCRSRSTDLGDTEDLFDFVQRHGGQDEALKYLKGVRNG
jgi:hypothetical protein